MSGMDADRQRRTSGEPDSPSEGGLTAVLWLLAVLIAELEFVLWFFERMYSS